MTPRTQAALAAGTITEVPWAERIDKADCLGCYWCERDLCVKSHDCNLCGAMLSWHEAGNDEDGEYLIYFDPDPNARLYICHECIDGYLAEAGTAKEAT